MGVPTKAGVTLFLAVLPCLLSPLSGLSQGTQGPTAANPHGLLLAGLDCGACHTDARWTPLKRPLDFDHARVTAFALNGAHRATECAACHLGLAFAEPTFADEGCASCHFDVHQGKLGEDCTGCHSEQSFTEVQAVEIHANTFFPLTGAHLQLSCDGCHANERRGAFSGQDTDCVFCHEQDYRGTVQPDHEGRGLSLSCEQCHGTLTWAGASDIGSGRAEAGWHPRATVNAAATRTERSWAGCTACHVEAEPKPPVLPTPAG